MMKIITLFLTLFVGVFSQQSNEIDFKRTLTASQSFPTNPTYGFVKMFPDSTCQNKSPIIQTVVLNVCLNDETPHYYQFICNSEKHVTKEFFLDANCQTTNTNFDSLTYGTTCTFDSHTELYFSSTCGNSHDPYAVDGDNYLIHSYYATSDCSTKEFINSFGFKLDTCLQNSGSSSLKVITDSGFVFKTNYNSTIDCTGSSSSSTSVGYCSYADVNYAYYNYDYNTYDEYLIKTESTKTTISTIAIIIIIVVGFVVIVGGSLLTYYCCCCNRRKVSSSGIAV